MAIDGETQVELDLLDARITTVSQTLSDQLDQHSVRIDAAQDDADDARLLANQASSSVFQAGIDATLYTDQRIQALRDEIAADYNLLGGDIDSRIDTRVAAEMAARLQAQIDAINLAIASANQTTEEVGTGYTGIQNSLIQLYEQDLAQVEADLAQNVTQAGAISQRIDDFFAGFASPTIIAGFQDQEAGILAQIEQQTLTEADLEEAVTAQMTTYNARVADVEASVEEQIIAYASLQGAISGYSLMAEVNNGEVAGIKILAYDGANWGTGSIIKLIADAVLVPNTLSAGVLLANTVSAREMVKTSAVVTETLQIGELTISVPIDIYLPAKVSITSHSSWVSVAKLVLVGDGYSSQIDFSFSLDGQGGGIVNAGVFRNGVLLESFAQGTGPRGEQTQVNASMVDFKNVTGATTYELRVRKGNPTYTNGANGDLRVYRRYFSVDQRKR